MSKYSYIGLFLTLTLPASSNETCNALTATAAPQNPPYSWQSNTKIIGTLPDTADLIAKNLEIPISVHFSGTWKRVQTNVTNGRFDMILGIYKSTERLKKYDYTISLLDDPVSVITLKNNMKPYTGTWASLKGYQGGTTLGDSFGNELDLYIDQHLTVHRTPNIIGMLRQLVRGRIHYGINGKFALERYTREVNVSKLTYIHATPLHVEPLYIAFSKKSPCKHLVQAFSKAINTLKAQGSIETILEENQQLMLKELAN